MDIWPDRSNNQTISIIMGNIMGKLNNNEESVRYRTHDSIGNFSLNFKILKEYLWIIFCQIP